MIRYALIPFGAGLLIACDVSPQGSAPNTAGYIEANESRFSDTNPRVNAEVRTSDGRSVGTVERVRFETAAHAVIDGYVVEYGGTLDVGGREVLIDAAQTSWSGRPLSPVLELALTQEELDGLPAFDEDRATDYPLADPVGENGQANRPQTAGEAFEQEPGDDARRALPADMARETGTLDASNEGIVWDGVFNPEMVAREDWLNRDVFTSSGDELGTVAEVLPAAGAPRALVVRTVPDFLDLGDTVELDLAQVTGVSQDGSAIQVNMVVVTREAPQED